MTAILSLVAIADRPLHLPVLVACLRAQTSPAWELLVLDQGDGECQLIADCAGDPRVRAFRVPRVGDWGQAEKARAARTRAVGDVLGFPNDDAYYCPVYVERMAGAIRSTGAGLAYCDWIYDQQGYAAWPGAPAVGHIDVGGFVISRAAFDAVGWEERGQTGDGRLVERVLAAGFASVHVRGHLYVKN